MAADGTTTAKIVLEGYSSSRGDAPTTTSRPTIDYGANTFSFDNFMTFKYLIVTGTSATGFRSDQAAVVVSSKISNTSGSAGRPAFSTQGSGGTANSVVILSELISTAGVAYTDSGTNAAGQFLISDYIHDSTTGATINTANRPYISNCIFDTISGTLLNVNSTGPTITSNTFYGGGSDQGTCLNLQGSTSVVGFNNIFVNCTTAVTSTATADPGFFDWNDFFSNTTDRTNVPVGVHDITSDPGFTDAPNGNFSVGTNMKAAGIPGVFSGGLSTGYTDIGAVQRQETVATTDILGTN